MADKAQFPRSADLPSQTALHWVRNKDRYLRQLLVADIDETTERSLVVLYVDSSADGHLDEEDTAHLNEVLERVGDKGIDVLLETNGGVTEAAEKIVECIRVFDPEYRVIVPYRAKSNGTIIALGSSEIIMGPPSELGPIEPSIPYQTTWLPVMGVLSTVPPERLDEAIEEIFDTGVATSFKLIDGLNDLAFEPFVYEEAYRALRHSAHCARRFLESGMGKDFDDDTLIEVLKSLILTEKYPSHGSVITGAEASKLGLKTQVLKSSDELWRRVWLLRSLLYYDCGTAGYLKLFESQSISNPIDRAPSQMTELENLIDEFNGE